jgi:hypothetical protein
LNQSCGQRLRHSRSMLTMVNLTQMPAMTDLDIHHWNRKTSLWNGSICAAGMSTSSYRVAARAFVDSRASRRGITSPSLSSLRLKTTICHRRSITLVNRVGVNFGPTQTYLTVNLNLPPRLTHTVMSLPWIPHSGRQPSSLALKDAVAIATPLVRTPDHSAGPDNDEKM